MTDQSTLPAEDRTRTTATYPPASGAGLEPTDGQVTDYRDQLRSDRWNAAPLKNPEVQKTDARYVVLGVVLLSVITLLVLVLGYGSGFWS